MDCEAKTVGTISKTVLELCGGGKTAERHRTASGANCTNPS